MGGDHGEVEEERPPRFRWLDAARYAAAFVVTVLMAVVVLKAIKVVLFPDALYVSVVHGAIFVTPTTLDKLRSSYPVNPGAAVPVLIFDLSLRVDNPRKHSIMYYVNVTAYLFDNDVPASTSNPKYDSLVFFRQLDNVVPQQAEVTYVLHILGTHDTVDPVLFHTFYNKSGGGGSMSGVTMRMNATLVVTDTSTNSNTSRPVTYYCWPLLIQPTTSFAADDLGDDDVFCREAQGDHFI